MEAVTEIVECFQGILGMEEEVVAVVEAVADVYIDTADVVGVVFDNDDLVYCVDTLVEGEEEVFVVQTVNS